MGFDGNNTTKMVSYIILFIIIHVTRTTNKNIKSRSLIFTELSLLS